MGGSPKSHAMTLLQSCWAIGVFMVNTAVFADEPPQGEIRYYVSKVDNSRQAYGVYFPRANPPSDRGYPVVMHGHGYGWWVGADFSLWQRQWADDHGWVLVNVNGRGPNFYDGIGEDDVLCVLADIARLVPIDRTRVYMTGGSMGGTGAYRMGIRRPNVFSAVAPVDGWTDFREFHWHWYERKDMPNAIEEFRRPLLEAVSPLYVAGTARWGDVTLIVDGLDNIVLPEQGVRLAEALQEKRASAPELYRHELVYHPNVGHGGGYDLPRIYERFLGVSGLERPPSVTIEATLLRYGKVHWAAIDRFGVQGAVGRLDVQASASTAYVSVRNVEAFSLSLTESPLAREKHVQVIVEGVPCYAGSPADVSFELERDRVTGASAWRVVAEAMRPSLRKRRGLEGPIGEAFLAPFVVVWGTAGDAASVRAGQIEAEDFANEWNTFNVHYDAVQAKPEAELTDDEASEKNLIVFGTLDNSSLLRQMNRAFTLPVQVFDNRIVVQDPIYGDRTYYGAKYGAYWVYPNPLTGFRTLVVGCRGRFATRPDGGMLRGLGYDLEKLQWAWPDYVVFDSDLTDLPWVENVNNKPPVTTYEAAYFVEAGFYDQDWQPYRGVELDRVRAVRPEGSRLIHVDTMRPLPARVGHQAGVEVRIVDEGEKPVRQARVTVTWIEKQSTCSRVTDEKGVAFFPAPTEPSHIPLRATLVNVCATGATYAWTDDRERTAILRVSESHSWEVWPAPARAETPTGVALPFTIAVRNMGAAPIEVLIHSPDNQGVVWPAAQQLSVSPGSVGQASFVWDPGDLPAGDYPLPITVAASSSGSGKTVQTTTPVFAVLRELTTPVKILRVVAPDRRCGEAPEVVAEIQNCDETHEITARVACVILEARRHLPTREVHLPPGARVEVRWQPDAESRGLQTGAYSVVVSIPDAPGAVGRAQFVVR